MTLDLRIKEILLLRSCKYLKSCWNLKRSLRSDYLSANDSIPQADVVKDSVVLM